jgi:streptogramin lyase
MTRHERIAGAHHGLLPTLSAVAAAAGLPFLAAVATTGGLAFLAAPALGQQSITYTLDADFDMGVLDHVNHTAVHDQLQLDVNPAGNQPFVCLSLSGNGTLVRFDANTGAFFGEYSTAPDGFAKNPSRIGIDSKGNAWVGNRDESSNVNNVPKGSVAKIGFVVGGTRSNADGSPNPSGQYLKGPFTYNTCVDRNNDGLIKTSRGLGDIRPWPNVTDGNGGADGIVQDADDECILIYQRTDGIEIEQVNVDSHDDVWVGGYPDSPDKFDKLDGNTGAILQSFTPTSCGGFGGVLAPDGILWSTSFKEGSLMRYDTLTNTLNPTCIPVGDPHALAIDTNGFIWVAEFDLNKVSKFAPDGTPVFVNQRCGTTAFDRALAVTPADNNVWITSGQSPDILPVFDSVERLDNNGMPLKSISGGSLGVSPRGVAVDANGKVWIGNFNSANAQRIDPNGGADHLGAIDMTVSLASALHPDPQPYNINNFTGDVDTGATQPNGTWTVIYDSGAQNTQFDTISYNSQILPGTNLTAEFRAANTTAALNGLPFNPVTNGAHLTNVFGQFMQVRVNFLRNDPSITASPVLFDLTITTIMNTSGCAPSGSPNPGSLLVFPEFDNRVGEMTLLTVTDTATSGNGINAEFVYIGRVGTQGQVLNCQEFNRTEMLTPTDTVTLITKVHDPNQNQGYVYVFAKDKVSGQPIVHNSLIGNELLINGIQALTYSNNPFVFPGIGNEGDPTDHDGDGLRDLNGIEYGCAPDQILVPRFLGQIAGGPGGRGGGPPAVVQSNLILINLTGGAAFTATIDFLVFNNNEEQFSTQFTFQCWIKEPLSLISNVFDNDFLATTNVSPTENIGIQTGWFRMDGNVANSTATSFPDPAFLAVLVETASGRSASDLPFEVGTQTNGSLLPHGIFGDTSP